MNKYKELREKQQEEYNKFQELYIFYAFSDDQFKEGMKKLGLNEEEYNKIVSFGSGCYVLKNKKEDLKNILKNHKKEIQEEIKKDTTGEGFIKDMFEYELENHEYGYTMDISDTLEDLGLNYKDIEENDNLLNGLILAKKIYIQNNKKIEKDENIEEDEKEA